MSWQTNRARPSRVLLVYGTRPELIKMAPVVHALRSRPEDFELTVCSTAQHREMVDRLQELFGITPDHDLNLMRPNQRLNDLTARAIRSVDRVLEKVRPHWLLVQGDTTTVMAAAMAAFHRGIRIGHVEAGLRTGDLRAPFPEEANRCITDRLADLLFAPTERSRRQLLAEGCREDGVFLTGNTVIDALHLMARRLPEEPQADEVLVTVHRRESFGEPILDIFAALGELADRFPDTRWLYPVHPNPRVAEPARELLGSHRNVELREPLQYDELVRRLRRVRLVLTDSGGIQEEAPTFGKPVLVLRDKTERPEGVEAGVARLVGTAKARIVAQTERLLTDPAAYDRMASAVSPYGDGLAAERIAAILASERPQPIRGWEEVFGVPCAASLWSQAQRNREHAA